MADQKILKSRLVQKHEYEVDWNNAVNFIPLEAEIIVYNAEADQNGNLFEGVTLPEDRTTPYTYARIKIGDGVTKVKDLPFVDDGKPGEITITGANYGQSAYASVCGERFNDYDDTNGNRALAAGSHAEGIRSIEYDGLSQTIIQNIAGCGCFEIDSKSVLGSYYYYPNFNITNKTITVKGDASAYAAGDVISVITDTNFDECATIASVAYNGSDKTVITLQEWPEGLVQGSSSLIKPDEQVKSYIPMTLRVVAKPLIGTTFLGLGAHTEGVGSRALADGAHAEGRETQAVGRYGHTEGRETKAHYAAHAEGWQSEAIGDYSHAEGKTTNANGYAAHAEGDVTKAKGKTAHAEGYDTLAEGNMSHAEGNKTQATGYASHAEGDQNIASNNGAHAEGYKTQATGKTSHAEGDNNIAAGESSHAEGRWTEANHQGSHAGGYATRTGMAYQTVIGKYNKGLSNTLFEIGGGRASAEESRKNAFEVYTDGHAEIATMGNTDMSITTKKYVDEEILNIETELRDDLIGQNSKYSNTGEIFNDYENNSAADYAHAEGYNTHAYSKYAHVEGEDTQVDAHHGHAEGYKSKVSSFGYYGHAEGYETEVLKNAAHAEGLGTKAYHVASHASGYYTLTGRDYQTVVGKYNDPQSDTLFEVGNGIAESYPDVIGPEKIIRSNAFVVKEDGSAILQTQGEADNAVVINSTLNAKAAEIIEQLHGTGISREIVEELPAIEEANDYTIYMVNSSSSSENNIYNEYLLINNSWEMIGSTEVDLTNFYTKKEVDDKVNAKPGAKTAQGGEIFNYSENEAFANYSHAEGYRTAASGRAAHAEGNNTEASGDNAHAEGNKTIASSDNAHAEGYGTTASGSNSHAEGSDTIASGQGSHAEGLYTTASGYEGPHAEGFSTTASGSSAHAEGLYTTASGYEGSHAEGSYTMASGESSHAEGYNTKAHGVSTHAEGNNTYAGLRGYKILGIEYRETETDSFCTFILETVTDLPVGKYSTILNSVLTDNVYSILSIEQDPITGYYKVITDQSPSADTDNINFENPKTVCILYFGKGEKGASIFGNYSHAEGNKSHATGYASHAEGDQTQALKSSAHAEGFKSIAMSESSHAEGESTQAIGSDSHAEGRKTKAGKVQADGSVIGTTAHAEGNWTTAEAYASHAEGSETLASAQYAHAEGLKTKAQGDAAHAEGESTEAIGIRSHAEGYKTKAYSKNTHTEGYETVAGVQNAELISNEELPIEDYSEPKYEGEFSHAEGFRSVAAGFGAHAEGYSTVAQGYFAHAEGRETKAAGQYSHAEGDHTIAYDGAHAEGYYTKATSWGAHAEGDSSVASGYNAHAEGQATTASEANSHAEGYHTIASGSNSHAEGDSTTASGCNSHASGEHTIANYNCQFVLGKYNQNKENTIFEIGNGTSENDRSNAFEVYKDGHAEVQAMGEANNSVATKEYVDNAINALETKKTVSVSLSTGYNDNYNINYDEVNSATKFTARVQFHAYGEYLFDVPLTFGQCSDGKTFVLSGMIYLNSIDSASGSNPGFKGFNLYCTYPTDDLNLCNIRLYSDHAVTVYNISY